MARKKAQHLYELLRQKTDEAKQAARVRALEPPAPPLPKLPAPTPLPKPVRPVAPPSVIAARRHVVPELTPLPTPMPGIGGREDVLENVITIRRDTAVVGVLLIVIIIVVAFVVGRATAPMHHEEVLQPQRTEASETKMHLEPGKPKSPATDEETKKAEVKEEPAPEPAPEPEPEPAPRGKYAVALITLDDTEKDRKEAEAIVAFLKKKNYAAEVRPSGGKILVQVPGFESTISQKAARALEELKQLEYKGLKQFQTAYWVKAR